MDAHDFERRHVLRFLAPENFRLLKYMPSLLSNSIHNGGST